MKKIILIIFSILFIVYGCGVKESFRYHETNERYIKAHATKIEVIKAMLECGFLDPLGWVGRYLDTENDHSQIIARHIAADQCMLNDGFALVGRRKPLCESIKHKLCGKNKAHLIPLRDTERRLNSEFCKAYPDFIACRP